MKPVLRRTVVAMFCLAMLAGGFGVSAAAESWSLVGNWRITVKGAECAPEQILMITKADSKRIVGTSHVGDGVGKMVDGSFDGVNLTFTDKFYWDGRNQSEKWTAKLTKQGNAISGSYRNNDNQHATCKFTGKRLVDSKAAPSDQAPQKTLTSTFG